LAHFSPVSTCMCFVSHVFFCLFVFFFFNDPSTSEIYTLSLHDALPISFRSRQDTSCPAFCRLFLSRLSPHERRRSFRAPFCCLRSEEHTSELQSRFDLVCRLLLEKKKKIKN